MHPKQENPFPSPRPLIVYEYRPGSIYLNITNRCTNACRFCSLALQGGWLGSFNLNFSGSPEVPIRVHPERLDAPARTDEPGIAEILAELTPHLHRGNKEIREIVFCGCGEPLIRLEEVLELSAFLKKHRYRVRVNTNGQAGMMHGSGLVDRLGRHVDEISISLNAHDARNYNLLCRPRAGEAAYEKLLAFADECACTLPRTVLSIVRLHTIQLKEWRIDLDEKACHEIAENLGIPLRLR